MVDATITEGNASIVCVVVQRLIHKRLGLRTTPFHRTGGIASPHTLDRGCD